MTSDELPGSHAAAAVLAASVSQAPTPSASVSPAAPVAAAAPSPVGAGREKKRRARGKNFRAQEDLRLCAAWLHVSEELSPTTKADGTEPSMREQQPQPQQDDSAASFWERVCDVFNDDGEGPTKSEDPVVRSYQSLQSRWSALQATIATFGEIVDQVRQELLSENKSKGAGGESDDTEDGTSADTGVASVHEENEELLKEAQLRYAERHPKRSPFTSLPCWEFLRNTPKWQKYMLRGTKNSGRPSSTHPHAMSDTKQHHENGAAVRTPETKSSKKRRADVDDVPATQDDEAVPVVVSKQVKRATELEEHTVVDRAVKEPRPVVVAVAPTPPPPPVVKGGGFLSVFSPPTAFANEDQVVQWTVRENRALPGPVKSGENGGDASAQTAATTQSFALFDDNRRIETLVGGEYELNLYLEPQGNDESKYYLEINGNAVTAFREQQQGSALVSGGTSSRRSSIQPPVSLDDNGDGDTIPFKTANVARVQLNKWDMVALRRKAGSIDSNASSSGGKTPFARFIIEVVR